MLKCMNLTLKQTFGLKSQEEIDSFSQKTNGHPEPEMGVRVPQLGSSSEFIASAASYLKGYMLNSLSDLSGTSSVAIDNKIEQAMDLVKSHLMFAVREEVEVLKEQIKDLLEKNAQLEYENKVLREDASADTLAKLRSIQS